MPHSCPNTVSMEDLSVFLYLSLGSLLLARKLTWKRAQMCFSQVCRVSAQGIRTIGTATDVSV